MTVDKGLFVHV